MGLLVSLVVVYAVLRVEGNKACSGLESDVLSKLAILKLCHTEVVSKFGNPGLSGAHI